MKKNEIINKYGKAYKVIVTSYTTDKTWSTRWYSTEGQAWQHADNNRSVYNRKSAYCIMADGEGEYKI